MGGGKGVPFLASVHCPTDWAPKSCALARHIEWEIIMRYSKTRSLRGIVLAGLTSIIVVACGGDAEPALPGPSVPRVPILADPSGTAIAVAVGEGLFDGCAVDITRVGYGQVSALFVAGITPITLLAPHEIANEQAAGEDVVYFTTAAALRFINGIVIRSEDVGIINDIRDLEGKTLGIPGFGTGTWSAFLGLTKARYGIDAMQYFNIIEAGAGTLLGLLEAGEIDAALTFASSSAAALGDPAFELLTSFAQEWETQTGESLVITGLAARPEWLANNLDTARCLVLGIDAGVDWMKTNPDALRPGGKYAEWVAGEGWHRDESTTEAIIAQLQADNWNFKHEETYTQDWIDAAYEFAEFTFKGDSGFPEKDELFAPADWLQR